MTRDEALNSLIAFTAREVATQPVSGQIALYEALSVLCPKEEERASAHQLQMKLESISGDQLKFITLLGNSNGQPEHDGQGGGN